MDKGESDLGRKRVVAPVALEDDFNRINSPIESSFLGSGFWRIFSWSRGGIGLRLVAAVLLFSSIVTLTLTALQLYLDYDREVRGIETRLDEIGRSYFGSIGESLWKLDQSQLELQLNGILRLPDIRAVEVSEIADRQHPIRIAVGKRGSGSAISRIFPLDYVVQGAKRQIGVLYVEATLTDVYRELLTRALVILASQAAKTFIVSFFIVYMFHWLVTRHLGAIAGFVSGYNVARPPPSLRLDRRPPRDADELDKVVDAFNDMCGSLQLAYGDLRDVNARLGRDLLVLQHAEEGVRLSEQRFRDYAETSSDWFWETGPDHAFTYVSERLSAFGIDRAALIGRSRADAAADFDTQPQKWHEHMAALERHEPFRNFEYTCHDMTGRQRHVGVNGRPIFAADGRFMGYRGTGADLTNQHEADERLRQSQKMDAIGQLTGGVAHDFNNVLTVITGTIDILRDGMADRPELVAVAQLMEDAATRGAEITSQLLTFARRQPLEPREIDVNGMVRDTVKLLKPILGEHVDIERVLADDAWPALADPSQLSAAIINLAVNARDAMPGGGRLTLETANVLLDDGDVSGDDEVATGEFVMIAVTDTGAGIPADIRDRVFEPFFTTKGIGHGTGLGLSMVYGFAKQSGGTVKIDGEEGRGTVIRLYLPRSAGRGAMKAEPVHATGTPHGHERVLVVEDDALVRGYVVAQLGSLGYRTLVANDGVSALALVDQGVEFDLLFTDMIMPGGMNGRELAEAVLNRRRGTKVLYTSGYTDNAIAGEGHPDPAAAVLRKPYRKAQLAQKIREVLGSG
jgi:PAS domain S-box-containing protein